MYYPCSENKDADQLRGYREADLRLCFRPCKLLVFSRTGSFRKLSLTFHLSHVMRKQTVWFSNRSVTNRAVQTQNMARGWKFWI